MKCPHCATENPAGAKFCFNCGQALAVQCPECGTSLPPNAKFCFNCGHQMGAPAPAPAAPPPPPAPPKAAPVEDRLQQFIPRELLAKLESARSGGGMEGERRVVTMLFCDVKGSTAAASALDPEEWAEIINGAFDQMIPPIYKYEGTVARLMGDGILAFFGAPIAHEDDPQRAVLAGLEILASVRRYREQVQRAWGLEIDVRVGINTGLVVVGAVGSDMRMEYTALGDAINLAARMEQTAQPGTVQIAEATHRLVAPLFEMEELAPLEVKGKTEPVRAWRVAAAKSQPGSLRGIAGLRSELVGRDREVAQLRAAVDAVEQGRGQIVSVMGEAGLGKSRLVAELRDALAGSRGNLQWLEGRSLSFESSTPYAPFVDILGNCLGVQTGWDDAANYQQIRRQVAALFPQQPDEIAPFLASVLGIRVTGLDAERLAFLEPPQLRGLTFAAVARFFETLSADAPLVLFFDDVHWIDPSSLELLESLLPLTDRASLLILLAFRPRRQESSWRLHETAQRDFSHRYSAIPLQPLDAEQSRQLVGNLLHVEDLPEKVRRMILDKSEGNPFFVEEVIRSLLDAKLVVQSNGHWRATKEIVNIAVPDTLNGVISARLDRLDDDVRATAQAAAVLGREFDFATLSALLDQPAAVEDHLADLVRKDLVREKSRLPRRVYSFKHVMTQEAAYNSMLLSRRREMHRRAAEAMAAQTPERAGEIARHFLEARQPAQALPHLVAAGDRAAKAYAAAEAIDFYQKAVELRPAVGDSDQILRAYEGLGSVQNNANQVPEAMATFQALLHLATEQGDCPMQVSALNKLAGVVGLKMGQFQQAEAYLQRADQLANGIDDHSGAAESSMIRCMMCTAMADFDSVIEHMDHLTQVGERLGSKEFMSMGMNHIASSLLYMTRFDEAWEKAQEALAVSREIGDRLHEAALQTEALPFYHIREGDLPRADAMLSQGLEIAERINAIYPLIYGNWLRGEIARWQGRYEDAIAFQQRSLAAALPMEAHMPFVVVQPLGALGSVYLELTGRFTEEVHKFHHHALTLFENPASGMGGASPWADMGWCALTINDPVMAEQLFSRGINEPSMFMQLEHPRFLTGMALLAARSGEIDKAKQWARDAQAYVEERQMRHFYPLIAFTEGRVLAAAGEEEQAVDALAQAAAQADALGMRPIGWQARLHAARILAGTGESEAAAAQKAEAQTFIDAIADDFRNPELAAAFRAHAAAEMEK